ncbi:MAG: LCCL domain-containing protein, partial [Gemmataceae bacterium]
MDPELLTLDELPREAREAIDASDREIADLRRQAELQAAEIRARADQAAAEVEDRAEAQVRQRQLALFHTLRPIQDRLARDGRLDEALAVRERVRSLRASLLQAQPDPGNLSHLPEPRVGASLLFEVAGSTDGVVWGSDVYTSDSALAAVAVHAGVLADGERGVVRVTFVDALNVEFVGSERNGVWSQDYGPWPIGFRI